MEAYPRAAMERAMKVQDVTWKRRKAEKSKSRLSRFAWKSRQPRGIPTFPQSRRLVNFRNRTCRVLQKPDILTCYRQRHFEPTMLCIALPSHFRYAAADRLPRIKIALRKGAVFVEPRTFDGRRIRSCITAGDR